VSERQGGGGGGSVWLIVVGVGAGLLILVLLVGGAGLFLVTRAVTVAVPPAQVDGVMITSDVARVKAPESTDGGTARRPARNCTVKLTGTGDGGTWYMIGQDIYEGDEALKAAVVGLVADAEKKGERLVVGLEVVPNAGITPQAVAAAGKACEATGAELAAPPAGERVGEAGK
jgi:hypothetical protein